MEILASSKEQRRTAGQSRRKVMSRGSHGKLKHGKGGRDAFAILRAAAVDRVPHLLELKYERMAASPFGYFRGAVPVMAYDLGQVENTGILTQLCGDAHVQNLGAFAAPDGRLVFDINDFDESIRGPFEWDVKRMAASIYVSAREAGESEGECREAVRVFLHRYGRAMAIFAAMPIVEIARYQIHRGVELKAVGDLFTKAERETPLKLRDGLTEMAAAAKKKVPPKQVPLKKSATKKSAAKKSAAVVARSESDAGAAKGSKGSKGSEGSAGLKARVFRSDPPVLVRLSDAERAPVLDSLQPYLKTIEPERRHLLSRYRPVDVAFKVVGTGSVGLRDYVVYMEGNGPDDPLFLQIKQEVASGWAPYVKPAVDAIPAADEAGPVTEGQRVVRGQRAMQVQSDPFLGWTQIDAHHFLVRQLADHKGSVNTGALDPKTLCHYADICGELLARGHARAGDPDELGGYIGKGARFEKAIAEFAKRYADQTEEDWKVLKKLRKG